MKSDNRSSIAFSLLLLVCSSCGAAGPPFLYPHTSSPYLIPPKVAEKKQEPASQSPSISSGSTSEKKETKSTSSEPQREPASSQPPSPSISSGSTSEKKEIKTLSSSKPQRERVFIDAPFDRTWQAVLKFCVLNKYQIAKESREDGTIECNIASNTAQYSTTSLPEDILTFVSTQVKVRGLVAWDITMAIFLSPSNNKTLVEFIPKFYAVTTESSHAKEELKSSGYFESSCVSFVSEEVKSY
ncbi:MAG: hypothetical protein ACM3SR_14555 [Ignavibacteriales bacterium]